MWVHGRQYSGRLVRITNDKIFDSPLYNYTREFPFVWEELHLPISFKDDRVRAERILLDVAERHTREQVEAARSAFAKLRERYRLVRDTDVAPRVFWRITDNWVELSLRFIVEPFEGRSVKDAMSREILAALDAAGIGIGSSTFEIVGLPPLRITKTNEVPPS